MITVFQDIWTGISGASWIEQAATILGLLGVVLTIRQSLWNFPIGLVQVVLSAFVFYYARLYADMKLQAVYFVALAYGWWHWRFGGKNKDTLPVTRLSPSSLAGWVVAGLVCTGVWGGYLRAHTDAAMPFRDAFISSFSLVAQWLQARKKVENWAFWMVVNASAVAVYWLAGIHWFAVLYSLLFVLAIAGHVEWWKAMKGKDA